MTQFCRTSGYFVENLPEFTIYLLKNSAAGSPSQMCTGVDIIEVVLLFCICICICICNCICICICICVQLFQLSLDFRDKIPL